MPQKFSNKARSQLLAAITTTDTSFSVVATEADLFPTADVGIGALPSAPGNWFKAVIEDSNGYEIVYVRTRSAGSNVFSNVLRGQEGTTARSFPAGAVVALRVTAQDAETAAEVPELQAQITGLASSKLDVAAPSFSGNAATATKLKTARTIRLSGIVSGSASFDGSTDATINTSIAAPISGKWFGGVPRVGSDGVMEIGKFVDFHETDNTTADFDGRLSVEGGGELYYSKSGGPPNLVYHSGNINTANAGTATKLQTARTLTIGNTGKSFDGSTNVSWSLAEIGLPPSISVVGPTSAYVTTTVTLTITDFDDFDAYNVTASHGTVSRSGATITYTAPGTVPSGGVATITIQRGTGQRTLTMQILPANVLPPTVTVTGEPSAVPEMPLIGTSAFQTVGVSDTHASTTWRVRRVADNSVVWESVNDTVNKTQITVPSGILQENTQYRFEAIHNGATLGASAVGFIQATTKQQFINIIGLVQVATGGGAGQYQRIDENFAPKTTSAAFFNSHATYADIVTQVIDGQSMVKIPKFYFKAGTVPSGTYAGKAYWMISDKPAPGFSVHPAFIGAGGAGLNQIWVGKYQASASGGKLQSVPGVLPRVSVNFSTARAEAYARNTGGVSGFRLWSYYDLAAIQMLATIEMGGLDMQALIGQGRVNTTSAANVDAADVAQATWRGIVGLWGNVWQMVDGIKRNGGNWWSWQYNAPPTTTTSDYSTGYVNTSRPALTSSGWTVTFDATLLASGIIAPATVDGSPANGSTGDYCWGNTSTDDRIWYHGGDWDDGAGAGLFCVYVVDTPGTLYSAVGARLAKV